MDFDFFKWYNILHYLNYKKYREFVKNTESSYIKADIEKNGLIIHYTSADGLLGILRSNKLRFTEASCLNDELEGNIVFDVLEEVLTAYSVSFKTLVKQEIEKFIHNENLRCFVCSFSFEKDALPLWNYYVKNPSMKGYNLRFSSTIIEDSLFNFCKNYPNNVGYNYFNVIYSRDEQVEFIKEILQPVYEAWTVGKGAPLITSMIAYLFSIRFSFKHETFSQEQEFRFVIYMENTFFIQELKSKDNESEIIKIQTKGDIIVPYIEIPFNKRALESICVSPLIKGKSALESINLLLGKYGYDEDIRILPSTIPLKY